MALTLPKQQQNKINLGDPAVRDMVMEELGIKKPKANFLQRLGGFLSAFETGNAAYKLARTGNLGEGIKQYSKDIGTGISGVFTGEVDTKKKTYSDVLDLMGVESKAVRGIVGFVGDVALDPTTYLTFGTKGVASLGKSALTKEGNKVAKLALKRADNEIAEIAGKAVDSLTKDEMKSALSKFSSRHGITLGGPLGDKMMAEVFDEFARKQVVKHGTANGVEVFSKPAARFMGAELFSMGERSAKAANDILNPTDIAFRNIGKVPQVKAALGKMTDLWQSLKQGGRKLFDTNYAASQGLIKVTGFDRSMRNMQDYVDTATTKFGYDADYVMERLAKGNDDVSLLPHMVESMNTRALPGLQKFYKQEDNIGDNVINKMFGQTVGKDWTDTAQKFIKAFDAGDELQMKAITAAIPDKELRKAFQKQIRAFKNGGRYVKIGGSIILNELPLARFANDLIEEANLDAQILEEIGLPNLDGYFGRKVEEIKGVPIKDIKKNAGAYASGSAVNDEKVLGKVRTHETRLQGIEQGGITYDVEKAMKGKKWEELTSKEQKAVRAVVTANILERRVKVQVARDYHTFLLYARDSALGDGGEKLSFETFGKKATDIIGDTGKTLKELRAEGWRAPEGVGNLFKRAVKGKSGRVKWMSDYIMPGEAADVLERAHKAFFSDEGTNFIAKIYDQLSSLWKTSVTTLFPAFHVRNGISNMFVNAMAGVVDPRVYKDAMLVQKYGNLLAKHGSDPKKLLEIGAKKIGNYKVDDWLQLAERHGVIGKGGYWTEISRGLADTRPGITKRLDPRTQSFAPTALGKKVGNAVEDNARIAHFIDRVMKGDGVEDAALSVKKYLFDYGDLTDFEKNVMRRVVPFYTWTRKNAELWTRIMVSNPGKFGKVLKGMRSLQDSFNDVPDEDIEKLPAWARAGFSVISGQGKTVNAVTGLGLPIEAYANTIGSLLGTEQQSALNMLGPIPRGIVEKATGISLFTGKSISEDTNGKKFRNMPGWIKDAIGYKEFERENNKGEKYIEYVVDPDAKYYLGLFAGRFTADAGKLYDMKDGADKMQILNFLTGIKRYEFDLAEEEEKRHKEAVQTLLDELDKLGYASTFKNTGITKDLRAEYPQLFQ